MTEPFQAVLDFVYPKIELKIEAQRKEFYKRVKWRHEQGEDWGMAYLLTLCEAEFGRVIPVKAGELDGGNTD